MSQLPEKRAAGGPMEQQEKLRGVSRIRRNTRSRQVDAYLLLSAITRGIATWQGFERVKGGEVVIGRLRYAVEVDAADIPILNPALREKLIKAAEQE